MSGPASCTPIRISGIQRLEVGLRLTAEQACMRLQVKVVIVRVGDLRVDEQARQAIPRPIGISLSASEAKVSSYTTLWWSKRGHELHGEETMVVAEHMMSVSFNCSTSNEPQTYRLPTTTKRIFGRICSGMLCWLNAATQKHSSQSPVDDVSVV